MTILPFWIISIAVLFVQAQGRDPQCIHTDICNCYDSNEFEYQCPKDNFSVVLHTIPGKYIKIDCYQPIPVYDLDILPDIEVDDLEYFSLRFCPLPPISFNDTLEKFNISTIKYMKLDEVRTVDSKNISKQLFSGILELQQLSITKIKIGLEEDFLEYLPNLKILYLEFNDIREIGVDTFKYVPKLRVLHLSRNLITHIPKGLFQGLTDLQQLHLWKNELTTLNKNSFLGLKHLKSMELSSNKIRALDEDTFAELIELVNISLRSNKLELVPSNIFRHNTALERVRLGDNQNLNLSDYVFTNLTSLLSVNIDNSDLESIPEHLFEGCVNLEDISLKNNSIVDLSEIVFNNLNKLRVLNLSGNKIKTLPNNIFATLTNLEELSLEGNQLSEINERLFRETVNLKTLNLRHNEITTIHLHAFIDLKELVKLDLSFNEYDLKYGSNVDGLNPFSPCERLKMINLSYNAIDTFPENIMDNKVSLVALDLRYNKIKEIRMASLIKVSSYEVTVSMNNNNVSLLDFREIKLYSLVNPVQNYDIYHNNNSSTILELYNNPIRCDCSNFDLIQYNNDKIDPVVKTLVDIRLGDLRCTYPSSFRDIMVKELKPVHITCPLEDYCPERCACDYRPYDEHAVVNCAHRNLTSLPVIQFKGAYSKVEMNLKDNLLEIGPYKGLGYDKVTKLFLSDNHIRNISWIPPHIEVLNLDGNNIKHLDSKILDNLSKMPTLRNLTLHGNPWSCGCAATALQNYLRSHFTKVKPTDVICEDNKKPLIELKELCKSHMAIAMAIAIPILIVLLTAAVVVALYFRYQNQIKVWLYAKNLCLWYVTEEELDKDKIYDVFISYSHKDEDFVLQNLLPVLEQGSNPFKVCIHIRDFIPGEFISTQITNSVLDSKRTLVVLSESFLESIWGKMEFRTAHTQAISDGRARVIIVKYGNLNEEKLDKELKSYLKTNTYVEWGDPWFWNKLKYALPHSKENRIHKDNQKHANIMLKIDDKFELVTSAPEKHAESTPPALPLDPSLLKDHPLSFKSVDTITHTDVPLIKR